MTRSAPLVIEGLPARYRPQRYLNRSGTADVVEAINSESSSTPIALKLLRAEGSRAAVARMMFRREVEALQGLAHDAIVQILDSFEAEGGLLGIELELVPGGGSLATLIEEVRVGREARPPLEWRVRMALRVLDGLQIAHRRDVIHRDLKPANLLWDRDEQLLKLADFGIASVLSLTARDPSGPTLRSFFTRPFASPEQLLQRTVSFPSDVYGFALLTASLLAVRAPTEDFEPGQLPALLASALEDCRAQRVSDADALALTECIGRALVDDANLRPSLDELQEVLRRIASYLRPRPAANVVLSATARRRLEAIGFLAEGKILDDLNADLHARLERGEQGESVRLFGRSLFVVAVSEGGDAEGALPLRAVDAGRNAGPIHESQRRRAESCDVQLRFGPGSSASLLHAVRAVDREATRQATAEIVHRARLIIAIERERLPVFVVAGGVQGGRRVADAREEAIGRAAGYEGAQLERVEVSGGFLLQVNDVRTVASAELKSNTVRAQLQAADVDLDDLPGADEVNVEDWHALLDEPDVDVLDDHLHMVGKITGYDRKTGRIQVKSDKPRRLLRSGMFVVKNFQKERVLRQQEIAIDTLMRGETARADMSQLLAEASVHRMGELPFVSLLQRDLEPEARVRNLVDRVLATKSVFCLQGPPGTGKTTIIAEVVAQLLEREPSSRILISSQANDAVANAIERIIKLRTELKRDWIIVRDVRAERAEQEGPWAGRQAAYDEFVARVQAGTASATADGVVSDNAKHALKDWLQSVEHGTRKVDRDYTGLVQVWGATTARSTRTLDGVEPPHFDLVVIDEAAKATVGEVLVPIVRAQRLLLVGDEKQLPPFLEDTTQQALLELGITEDVAKYSLFEHLLKLVPKDHHDMLNMQFRMHPTIGDVVSTLFYGGKVSNGPKTKDRPLPAGDFDREHRVMWVDVVGRDVQVGKTSRANDAEISVIERLLQKLDADAHAASMPLKVAVIAAYRGQAERLAPKVRELESSLKLLSVSAATVDSFQGREADVVIYSLVRTGDAERVFLADGRRFNVALSRAKRLLIMVGDRTGSRSTPRLRDLLGLIPEVNQVAASSFVPAKRLGAHLDALLKRNAPPKGGDS